MKYLSLTDLFLVGLAFDITGAVLLGKGLLLSPRMLAKLNTFWGLSHGQPQDRCENRVAGEFGLGYLVVGFFFQAVGYALDIAGVQSETGAGRLVAGLLMGAAAAALAWAGWALSHGPRLRALESSIERKSEVARQEIADEKAGES